MEDAAKHLSCQGICLPLYLPFYSLHHPSVQRIKLCAVKTQLYNPCLPTLRRMEVDTVCQKMPEEHSQTTTTCGQADFDCVKDAYAVPPLRFRIPGIELAQKQLRKYYATPGDFEQNRREWSNHLHCPRPKPSLPAVTQPQSTIKDLHASSLGTYHPRPESCFPKRSISDKIGIDRYGQKLVPCEQFSCYRDTWAPSRDPLSHEPWRKYADYPYPESRRRSLR